MSDALPVRLYYDFASTLCYVAHRTLPRLEAPLATLGLALDWQPLDLARLVGGFRRGAALREVQRANAARVAEELGVAVRVPRIWPDARALGAAARLAERAGRGAAFRERAFSAVFEEGRLAVAAEEAARLAAELGLSLAADAIRAAEGELDATTVAAREELVSGVPTFMLGRWPFGGIQSDETMLRVLERYARKVREGSLA